MGFTTIFITLGTVITSKKQIIGAHFCMEGHLQLSLQTLYSKIDLQSDG